MNTYYPYITDTSNFTEGELITIRKNYMKEKEYDNKYNKSYKKIFDLVDKVKVKRTNWYCPECGKKWCQDCDTTDIEYNNIFIS